VSLVLRKFWLTCELLLYSLLSASAAYELAAELSVKQVLPEDNVTTETNGHDLADADLPSTEEITAVES
jgi:hypothetical protein